MSIKNSTLFFFSYELLSQVQLVSTSQTKIHLKLLRETILLYLQYVTESIPIK